MPQTSFVEPPPVTDLPAYVPFPRFIEFLDRLESAGVPARIHRSYWGRFFSGAVGGQLIASLRFFRLIDADGEVQARLPLLVPRRHRSAAMRELVRGRYQAIFAIADPATATRQELYAAFTETYAVDGDTRRKAVTFLLKACDYAGLPVSRNMDIRATPGQRFRGRPDDTHGRSSGLLDKRGMGAASVQDGLDGRSIDLGPAGSITLSIRVNLLTLQDAQREQLLRLVDAFRALDPAQGGAGHAEDQPHA